MENRKALKVAIEGRRTGMGGKTICFLYSLGKKRVIRSVHNDRKPGRTHWTEYYRLYPAKYLLAVESVSNRGNHNCYVAIVKVEQKEDKSEEGEIKEVERLSPDKIPKFVIPPCECLGSL